MFKSPLTGDPVPGIELFLEEEPDDEPIASATTDAKGTCRLSLPAKSLSIKVLVPRDSSAGAASILVRIRDDKRFIVAKALAVPFDRASSAPLEFSLRMDKPSESATCEVLVLDPRSPVEQALLTGVHQRDLQSASCARLLDAFQAALATQLGQPSKIIDKTRTGRWPLPVGIDQALVFCVASPAGQLQITISLVVRLVQGRPVLTCGGKQATSIAEAQALAGELHAAILKSLSELRGLPPGIDIVLWVPDPDDPNDPNAAPGSKGGFAVGGFSTL